MRLNNNNRRKGFRADPGFAIELKAHQFEHGEGLILEQLVDAGWGRLRGKVLANGRASLKLQGNYLDGEKSWTSSTKFPNLKGVSCDISLFTSGESYPLIRDKKILTKSVLADLREEAGVRVYLNAFRVFPMGERGDDWLSLDRDAAARKVTFSDVALNAVASHLGLDHRTPLLRPRNENLLGRVQIDDVADHELQIKMNREGFVETEGLHELIQFVRLAIEWMTIFYAQARNRYEREQVRKAKRAFEQELSAKEKRKLNQSGQSDLVTAETALDFLARRAIESKVTTETEAASEKRVVKLAEQVVETRIQELDSELGVLRTLASTAPLLFTFAHEVSALIGQLSSDALRIDSMAKSLPFDARIEANAIARSLRDTSKDFTQMSELFGIVTSIRQSKPIRHYAHKILQRVADSARFLTGGAGIDVRVRCSDVLKSPRMLEAELLSIVVNLFSNSIKSCLAAQQSDTRIQIIAHERSGNFVLEVLDRGVGLPEKYWKDVLEPFCSDPADRIYSRLEARIGNTTVSTLGRGSGLGLSIVNAICKDYGGSVAISKPNNWSLSVKAILPLITR